MDQSRLSTVSRRMEVGSTALDGGAHDVVIFCAALGTDLTVHLPHLRLPADAEEPQTMCRSFASDSSTSSMAARPQL